ncbi:MAG: pentapeptide repeat-containing protein [Moorea sp. SIO4A1]|uniref:pentapeptide repeat-containing protein n=1 Tax=Moorena sp. SIO4A1 TaxID=2607835 RepID=UPI00144ECA41|nr:pentapeptide repeat-containing protein [Moorena sp. SIO4A1]NEQ58411.1 pentapeptide repeat-containing protein [Moorena sp. SIO4A1]
MKEASQVKKKLTITASSKGIEKAEKALIRLGFESKSKFAKSQFIGRSTVTKFFQSQPIQLDSFKRICQALTLDWKEIAGIADENQSELLSINDGSSSELLEGVEQGQAPRRKVTVIDKQSETIKASIVLEGDIDSVQNLKHIQSILRDYSGYSINIIDIKPGSIRLIIEGSPEDIERLRARIESGEIKELSGFPVQDIQILSERSEHDQNNELDSKWRLVEEIASRRAVGRDWRGVDLSDADLSGAELRLAYLSGANLSDADLRSADLRRAKLFSAKLFSADLSGANLSGANLIDANLIDANLIGANLIGANLSRANLSRANLIDANLSGAKLSGANLIGAEVKNAQFGYNSGIDQSMKGDLIQRGAIFEDLPGDRSESLTPSKR